MRVLVLGDGILGSEIVKQTGWDYISRKKDGFDITCIKDYINLFIEDYEGVIFVKKYDCIVNCIAYTNTYDKEKQKHWDVNYKSVIDLTNFCNTWNIKLVHISTSYVYVNSNSNVKETDIPIHDNTWYSYTKLLADAYIEAISNNYLICREIHKEKPFKYDKAWIDQVGNFDYVDIISDLIIKLINNNASGIFNVGTEFKSMYQLAKITKSDVKQVIKPYYIPNNVSMNTDKLKNFLNEFSNK